MQITLVNYIKDLSQMKNQSQVMIKEMEKNDLSLQYFWEGITRQEFYQKIQEWYGLMETSSWLLGEIGEEMAQIQKIFDDVDGLG